MKRLWAVTVCVLLVSVTGGAFGHHHKRRKGADPEICALKTVYVRGNSESADIARREIAQRTWLGVADDPQKADAVLDLSERTTEKDFPIRTMRTTVSGELKKGSKLLWSDSAWFDEGVFNSGAGSAVKILLSRLNKAANCH